MTMFATQAPGEVIDAIRPDLEAFTSLWTALRVNYEGTNITRTVARLLHMYQPEEGVIAYERLLRTLFVLLEDFDSDGLRLLVSMVPPPKGVNDEIVKEVFNRATGFVRVDAPIFHKNTYFQCTGTSLASAASTVDIPYPRPVSQSCSSTTIQKLDNVLPLEKLLSTEQKKNLNSSVENDPNAQKNRMKKSPQITSQESADVFRGFPSSEIFNTQSHVQNIKNFYRPTTSYAFPSSRQSFINFGQINQNSGQIQPPVGTGLVGATYRPKWFQSPYLMQKNSYPVPRYHDFYLKTINNHYVKVPAIKLKNYHQANVSTSQASYQNLYKNTHNYLKNRSNTTTSGLLEKVQQHRSLREVAIKNILTDHKFSNNAAATFSDLQVPDDDSDPRNVEFKSIDTKVSIANQEEKIIANSTPKNTSIEINSKIGNLTIKTVNGDSKINLEDFTSDNQNPTVNHETFEQFAQEVRMRQRAIQEDIYKMDVVHNDLFPEERSSVKEDTNSIKPEILTASEELRISCKKFIDRAKTEESVEIPIFPRTRSLSEMNQQLTAVHQSESNLWRLLTSKDVSGNNSAKTIHAGDSPDNLENSLVQETAVYSTEVMPIRELESSELAVPKRVTRRKKLDVQGARAKSQTVVQNLPTSHVVNLLDELNSSDIRSDSDVRMKNNFQSESATRCSIFNNPQTSSSSASHVTTMTELAAYKKQYYDALLSIQKAKAAVANSLAISSVGSSTGFDPYYYNYMQHQRHQILQRHQHQMIMGHHRFSHQQSLPTAPLWFGSTDWRYPVVGHSRLNQRPQMLHPTPSPWPQSVGFLGRDSEVTGLRRQQPNINQQSKSAPLKRRKLEEIVGKLKETESNSANN